MPADRHLRNRSPLSRRSLLLTAALLPWSGLGLAAAPAKGEQVELPPLTLLDGSTLGPADLKGRPVVIVFWSTDCAYCKRHNARLDKLHRQVRAAGGDLRIVAIATDTDPQVVRRHMQHAGHGFPVALEAGGIRARLTDRRVVPLTVLIDRAGRLRQVIPGELTEEDMLGLAKG